MEPAMTRIDQGHEPRGPVRQGVTMQNDASETLRDIASELEEEREIVQRLLSAAKGLVATIRASYVCTDPEGRIIKDSLLDLATITAEEIIAEIRDR